MTGDAPFEARFSPWRRLLGIALAAGFVALGLWIAGVIGAVPDPAPWIGWPAALVFAGFGAIGLRRLGQRGVAVRVDAAGIWLWRPDGGVTIPWAAIVAADVVAAHRQKFIALTLDDPERYRKPGPIGGLEAGMGFGDVAIGVQATDRRFAELEAAVARFGPD